MEGLSDKLQMSLSKETQPTNEFSDGGPLQRDSSECRSDEGDNEHEVEAYFQRMKRDMTQHQRTPDISTDTNSDELELKMSRNLKNIHNISLDSDEDEMRKDFLGSETNFQFDKTKSCDSESDDVINNLDNIHFTELETNEVELNENEGGSESYGTKDYLPKLHLPNNSSSDEELVITFLRTSNPSHTPVLEEIEREMEESIKNCETDVDVTSIETEIYSKMQSSSAGKTSQSFNSKNTSGGISCSSLRGSRNSKTNTKNSATLTDTISQRYSKNIPKSSQEGGRITEKDSTQEFMNTASPKTRSSQSHLLLTSSEITKEGNKESTEVAKSNKYPNVAKRRGLRDGKRIKKRNASTQTKIKRKTQLDKDLTREVIEFRYDWQKRKSPHRGESLNIGLAANNILSVPCSNRMMELHSELSQQLLFYNRRLYHVYKDETP